MLGGSHVLPHLPLVLPGMLGPLSWLRKLFFREEKGLTHFVLGESRTQDRVPTWEPVSV